MHIPPEVAPQHHYLVKSADRPIPGLSGRQSWGKSGLTKLAREDPFVLWAHLRTYNPAGTTKGKSYGLLQVSIALVHDGSLPRGDKWQHFKEGAFTRSVYRSETELMGTETGMLGSGKRWIESQLAEVVEQLEEAHIQPVTAAAYRQRAKSA